MITKNLNNSFDHFLTTNLFFDDVFKTAFDKRLGYLEIKSTILKSPYMGFFRNSQDAALKTNELYMQGIPTWFGVNPRYQMGKFWEVLYTTSFHAELCYGESKYYESSSLALKAVEDYYLKPNYIIDTSSEIQCLWCLRDPASVLDVGHDVIERVNLKICTDLCGNVNATGLDTFFRVPEAHFPKLEDDINIVTVFKNHWRKYTLSDFGINLIENKGQYIIETLF